ncbi:DUF6364 family protein [Larkinella humicola]|uniref:Antitoxin n=1 Tax=Larkinella humicola TaxID=2607654 RepID=A0A5N1JC60_9BACT|nr:DUF6364 family protein [Larkinella humicola]KAA9349323.1 hypothetical protein F0P93_23305 [Larkinella humicola]
MDTKLTLKLDEDVIQQAKIYAASQNRSLSGLVEGYLKSLVSQNDSENEEIKISPFVKSMTSRTMIPSDLDTKDEYNKHLMEKYR